MSIVKRIADLTELDEAEVLQTLNDVQQLKINPLTISEFIDSVKQAYTEISPTGIARMEFKFKGLGLDEDRANIQIARSVTKEVLDINKLQGMAEEYINRQTQDAQPEHVAPEVKAYSGPTEMLQDPAMANKIAVAMDDVATQMDQAGFTYSDAIMFHYNGVSSIEDQLEGAGLGYDQIDQMLKGALEKQGITDPDMVDMAKTAMARSPHTPEINKPEVEGQETASSKIAPEDMPGNYGNYRKFYDGFVPEVDDHTRRAIDGGKTQIDPNDPNYATLPNGQMVHINGLIVPDGYGEQDQADGGFGIDGFKDDFAAFQAETEEEFAAFAAENEDAFRQFAKSDDNPVLGDERIEVTTPVTTFKGNDFG